LLKNKGDRHGGPPVGGDWVGGKRSQGLPSSAAVW
jgi:hypothetical protein